MPVDENLPAFFMKQLWPGATVFSIAFKLLKQGLNYFQPSFCVLSFLSLRKNGT